MTTVEITTNANAPQALIDQLTAFARDLDLDGITVTLDLLATCTICGCTWDHACIGGCIWVNDDEDLCSSCAALLTHAEHVTVTTWDYACIEGECEHVGPAGEPIEDLSACPSVDREICVDCMQIAGYTRDEEHWDFTPLTVWPCAPRTTIEQHAQDAS